MRAREADALDPVDGVASAQELAEVGPDLRQEVAPVRIDVLPQKRDLADAFMRKSRHLGHDVAGTAALLAPANRRHDAVGALRIAAHRHLNPRLELPLPVHREVAGEGPFFEPEAGARHARPAGAEPVPEVVNRSRAERDVDERIQAEETLSLRLGVAPPDGDDLVGVPLLQRARLREMSGEPLIGLLADGARVEDQHVRVLLRLRLAESELFEHALDALGVVRVHLAAEGRHVVAPHRANTVPPAFWTPPTGCTLRAQSPPLETESERAPAGGARYDRRSTSRAPSPAIRG